MQIFFSRQIVKLNRKDTIWGIHDIQMIKGLQYYIIRRFRTFNFRCERIIYLSVPLNNQTWRSNQLAIKESWVWFIICIQINYIFHLQVNIKMLHWLKAVKNLKIPTFQLLTSAFFRGNKNKVYLRSHTDCSCQ